MFEAASPLSVRSMDCHVKEFLSSGVRVRRRRFAAVLLDSGRVETPTVCRPNSRRLHRETCSSLSKIQRVQQPGARILAD